MFNCVSCGANTDAVTDSWVEVKRVDRITSLLSGYRKQRPFPSQVFCSDECRLSAELTAEAIERKEALAVLLSLARGALARDGLVLLEEENVMLNRMAAAVLAWWGSHAFGAILASRVKVGFRMHHHAWKYCTNTEEARKAFKICKTKGSPAVYLYMVPLNAIICACGKED